MLGNDAEVMKYSFFGFLVLGVLLERGGMLCVPPNGKSAKHRFLSLRHWRCCVDVDAVGEPCRESPFGVMFGVWAAGSRGRESPFGVMFGVWAVGGRGRDPRSRRHDQKA